MVSRQKKRVNTLKTKKNAITLKTLSVFLIVLGAFLFALSTIGYFTGFSIYDPHISGDTLKTASWNYTNPDNYTYNTSLTLGRGVVTFAKPSDHVETLSSDFVPTIGIDTTADELKLLSVNGTYSNATYTSGVYNSGALDTNWNNLGWTETLNGQSITVSYRTGNVADLDSVTWTTASNGASLTSDGQYFQYKVDFITNGLQTPVVTDVTLSANYYTSGTLETNGDFLPASLLEWGGFYASDSGSGITYAYNVGSGWVSVTSGTSLSSLGLTNGIRFKVVLSGDGTSSPSSYGFNVTYNVSSNAAPVLAAIGNKDLVVGEGFSYDVESTDANNDTLTYSDDTAMFVIDPSTGLINFTPSTEGNYTINISVSDGSLEDSELVVWEVSPAPETEDEEEDDTIITQEDDSSTVVTSDDEAVDEEPAEGTGEVVADVPIEEVPAALVDESVVSTGILGNLLTGFSFVTGGADPKVGGAVIFSFVLLGLVASHYLFYVKGYWVNAEDSGKFVGWIKGLVHRRDDSGSNQKVETKNKRSSLKR